MQGVCSQIPCMHSGRQLSPGGLVRTAGLAALLVIIIQTSADADLWGHVRFGQDIIDAGGVPAVDGYSFTTDQAWINHEWLAEVGMSLAYAAGGPLGLVVFAILAGIVPLTGTMRPQVFSLVCFSALLVVLASAKTAPRRLWWLPPLFALWVNLHGGWVVGLGVLGVWSAARILDTPQPRWQAAVGLGVRPVSSRDTGQSLRLAVVGVCGDDRRRGAGRHRRMVLAFAASHSPDPLGANDARGSLGRLVSTEGRRRPVWPCAFSLASHRSWSPA